MSEPPRRAEVGDLLAVEVGAGSAGGRRPAVQILSELEAGERSSVHPSDEVAQGVRDEARRSRRAASGVPALPGASLAAGKPGRKL